MRDVDRSAPPGTQRSTYAQVRWWAPVYVVSLTALGTGIATLLAGEQVAIPVGCFAMTVVAGSGGLRARKEFRRGWRAGRALGVRVMGDGGVGGTYPPHASAAECNHVPEPWDEPAPLVADWSWR